MPPSDFEEKVFYFSQNSKEEERIFLSQDISCVGRDSNPGYNDYESKALPLDPVRVSMMYLLIMNFQKIHTDSRHNVTFLNIHIL